MESSIFGNLATLTENNSVNNVVVSGTWDDETLDMLLDTKPHAVVLLEPTNEYYQAKTKQYAESPSVKVIETTLADSAGQANYFLFQPHRFNSLLKPKKLQKIYRKQNANNVIDVTTIDLHGLCEQESISKQDGNVLLLGINCPSLSILNPLQKQALTLFDVIIVRYPQQNLYDLQCDQATFLSLLSENNFKVTQEVSRDALFTQFVFTRDYQVEKIHLLLCKVSESESRILDLETTLSKEIVQNEENNKKNDAESAQLKEEKVKLQKTLVEKNQEVDTLHAQLAEEKEKNQGLQTSAKQAEKGQIEFLNELEKSKQNIIIQQAKIAKLDRSNQDVAAIKNTLEKQLNDTNKKLEEQTHWHRENKKFAEGLSKKLQDSGAALTEANEKQKSAIQTLSLNTKLMTKLEMDNEMLRTTLAVKHNDVKELKTLIIELHEKLQLASEFYHQVQKNYPKLISSES